MTRISRRYLRALDGAALLAILSPALILLVAYRWPHVLDGTPTLGDASIHANLLRNGLELTSFAATTGLLVTALLAVLFTLDQIEEAQNARLADVYMTIVERFNSQEQVNSRKLFYELRKSFKQLNPALAGDEFAAKQALYVSQALADLGTTDPMKEREYLVALYLFEDLGILCRKNYVKKDDIFDLFGDHVISIMTDLLPYVKRARDDYEDQALADAVYANAAYLFAEATQHSLKSFTYSLP
jgi:hypothetical protein